MAKALGTTPEEEHRPGLAPLARVSTLLLSDYCLFTQSSSK